jgi:hypothetical protein
VSREIQKHKLTPREFGWLAVDVGCEGGIRAGMSGSPVLSDDGSAIGIVCTSAGTGGSDQPHTEGGPNPRLMGKLPGWCIKSLKSK